MLEIYSKDVTINFTEELTMTAKIINGLKYWGQLLLLPVYWLSFLVPRDKHIWIFGSTFGRRFADNPKYFYLYMSQHHSDTIRSVWVSHDKRVVATLKKNGYEAFYYHSLKGIWLALRARVYIFDNYSKDINFWQSGRALKVNLWHGVGNKCINYDNVHDEVRHPKNLWERFKYFPRRLSDEKPNHYVLATSPTMCDIFARAFRVSRDHVIEAGYPRNDYILGADIKNIFSDEEQKALLRIQAWRKGGGKISLYMPTFRESEKRFMNVMNLKKFNEFLRANDLLFVTKLHPKSKIRKAFLEINYSNILNLDADMDPYIFLRETDVLVTDYSSIYSDFMLLKRPVVAFWYDYAEYLGETRDAYFDFEEYMPEEKAFTMDELMDKIVKVLQVDIAEEKRNASREKIFEGVTANGCETIIRFIKGEVLDVKNSRSV